ncbi:aminotransferase-like domain-containing protein [Lutispora saccharofermentans]|uniref:PLP-dependent aminotransferase family protein n=1 Tax=Lutispora saccharofermentans TaxID=3024236 RepID=A0ABT1NHP5_9FIRM|nr:PLP-dependent aminotransferase family protein [Lutispora saccharofermentans]MCQ1530780.1 PLP-dependent aminotransferase family protein [Lutispora saccharofermentans]
MSIKYAKRMEYIKGSAIRELLKLTEQPEIISFAGGLPAPELFPIEEMKEVCLKVLDTDGKAALQYSTTEGYLPLRKIISERMRYSGIEIPADDILITSGSQQGLEFSGKVFLDEGDTVICESPSYLGALNAFKSYLPRFVEVEMDNEGMKMDELEKALEANPNAKFIYTIPDFQNPSGITMSFERRKRLVELSVKYNVPIVEDNPYGDLRFEGERIPAVKHFDTAGMVIYLGTFSKTFSPGLRVGWVAASPEIVRKYVLVKQGADLQCNSMAQRETAAFVQMFDIDKHINKIIEVYGRRRTLMIETMEKEFPKNVKFTYPSGGLFTWVELPEGVDAAAVLKKALEEKVAFVPGGSFYPNGGNENHFRLNYSCMPEDKIVEGITRLGKVLKTL